ncbi:hypothetical protein [Bradyrhizobium arachidis]|uniref:hypothetical protein n=1 Tax=Bradyrhizobium arachidis TaxID=858423 RepID=UPI002162C45B|nr:hypothetical protein [Bradyrhizobium arachidis]UVO30455.1 hypothetical protein KUF59_07115 [Bradyrhizobium arachidis]
MTLQHSRPLGILCLERGGTPSKSRPGSILHPTTFSFPVISDIVEGAWADVVIRGDPPLESAYVAAARRLVEQGAVAISSNCGFSMRYQSSVAAAVNVPVALSSLLLLPTLLRQLPVRRKLVILTADSSCCDEALLGIEDPAQRARVVIGGIEGGKLWQNEMVRPPPYTETSEIEADVVACLGRLQVAHEGVAAILCECTGFPPVASAIRRITRLPVYDVTDLCRMTMASVA